MHTALRAELVLAQCPLKVASLAAWGDKCVVGTQCGALLVLGEVPSPPPNQHVLRFEVRSHRLHSPKVATTQPVRCSTIQLVALCHSSTVKSLTRSRVVTGRAWRWKTQAIETKKAVAKRALTQLAVLSDPGFLVSLGDVVAVHALHGLTAVTTLSKTKGATCVTEPLHPTLGPLRL